jgi:hypothetical protein
MTTISLNAIKEIKDINSPKVAFRVKTLEDRNFLASHGINMCTFYGDFFYCNEGMYAGNKRGPEVEVSKDSYYHEKVTQ